MKKLSADEAGKMLANNAGRIGGENVPPSQLPTVFTNADSELSRIRAEMQLLRGQLDVLQQLFDHQDDEDEDDSFELVQRIQNPASFECYIDKDGNLKRRAGYRCITDNNWEFVDEMDCGPAYSGQQPWMEWRHTALDENGNYIAGTGVWYEGNDNPPVQNATNMVFVFCTVEGDGPLYIINRHVGDVRAIDIMDC